MASLQERARRAIVLAFVDLAEGNAFVPGHDYLFRASIHRFDPEIPWRLIWQVTDELVAEGHLILDDPIEDHNGRPEAIYHEHYEPQESLWGVLDDDPPTSEQQPKPTGEAETPPWHIGDVNRCLEALEAHQEGGFDIWQSAEDMAKQIPQGASAVKYSMFWKGYPDEKGVPRNGIKQRRQEERRQRRDLKSHSELT